MVRKLLHSTSLKLNLASNFIGNTSTALIAFVFIPFYLQYLGAEAYGLIGVFASIQVILFLLDSGLGTTLNREIARLSSSFDGVRQMRNLTKTLETIYWILAIAIGLVAVLLTPFLATGWVKPEELSPETIKTVFFLLSISLIFQFPVGFYSGGLLGLQKHLHLNMLKLFFSLLKNGGAILVLTFYSNTVIAFFQWILAISIVQVFGYRLSVWYFLPESGQKTVFDKAALRGIWRFAAGITGISLTAVVFSQIDKIILSRTLSLEQFGYYSIASTLGLILYQILGPITQAYFPKFSSLTNKEDEEQLKLMFHQSSQLLGILVLPATFILVFFSKELLWIWSQNENTVNNTWVIVAIFAGGTGINGLLNIPYQLTLAFGWTRLGLFQNIFLLCLMIPLTTILSTKYGVVGGASSWLIVNTIYIFITPYLIHTRLLKGEVGNWYLHDTLKPLFISLAVVVCFKYFIYDPQPGNNRWLNLMYLMTLGIVTVLINLLFVKDLRQAVNKFVERSINIFARKKC